MIQSTNNYFAFGTSCNLTNFGQLHLMAQDVPVSSEEVLIDTKNDKKSVAIFPNPVTKNGILTVDLGTTENARLRIYTTSGKLVKDFILNNNRNEISTGLSSGMYLYSIQTEDKIWNGRLMVIE